jgi:hypothetical protein
MFRIRLTLFLAVSVIGVLGLLPAYGQDKGTAASSEVGAAAQKERAGIFRFALPAGFRPVSSEKRQAIKRAMFGGGANLARSSGLADPSASAIGDLWAYESADSKYLLVFISSEDKADVREADIRKSNIERVEWGKKAGHLLSKSRAASGPTIAGFPTILTDMFMGSGRMQSYDLFVTEQPKYRHTISITYDGPTFDDKLVADFLASVTLEIASK